MKKIVFSALLLCLLGLPLEAVAQVGPYTKTGFGLGGGFSAGGNGSTIGGHAGYAFGSPFEFGGELLRRAFDDFDLTATRFGPYLAFYPIREDDGYPFSILMRGSYKYVRYSGGRADAWKREGGSDTANRYRFEIGGFAALDVSDSLQLLPYLGVSYALRTEADVFQSRRELTGLNFRLSVQYEVGEIASVVVAPTAFLGENDVNRFGGSAAFVFSTTGDE